MTVELEKEMPGWVWVLTVQGDVRDPEEDDGDKEFEDDDDMEFGGDIVGCYATRALLEEDALKMGPQRYGIFHLKVEGWK